MSKKDEILQDFLKHEYLLSKYGVKPNEIPEKMNECMNSEIPIVRAIAFIVKEIELNKTPEKTLYNSLKTLIQTTSIE